MKEQLRVAVVGCGNVGVAAAADLSILGNEVSIIKTSDTRSQVFDCIRKNGNSVWLKENGTYNKAVMKDVSHNLSSIKDADVILLSVQSNYHEDVIKRMSEYLHESQVLIIVCSYLSSFYVMKYCKNCPVVVETTGPFLEGRIEEDDRPGEIVFRVGCRLVDTPISIVPHDREEECMAIIKRLDDSFNCKYNPLESALLNPNLVLHTVGAIMSIPRIEFSHGNFCMYREAYARGNNATLNLMLALDKEKMAVLESAGCRPIDIFDAGGFLGNQLDSFYRYSESEDRAISPTSVKSRYITEDVPQGLVLLESIAKHTRMRVPITTSLIDIAGAALERDFRKEGRTIESLGAVDYIDSLIRCNA